MHGENKVLLGDSSNVSLKSRVSVYKQIFIIYFVAFCESCSLFHLALDECRDKYEGYCDGVVQEECVEPYFRSWKFPYWCPKTCGICCKIKLR